LPIVAGLLAILAVLLALGVRHQRQAVASASQEAGAPIIPGQTADPIVRGQGPERGPTQATLVIIDGPDDWKGRRFDVSETPLTLGTRPDCGIRLPEAPGIAGEHLRLWARDGKVMLHHLARGMTTSVAGNSITWASLAPGDELHVGPYVFRYISSRPSEADAPRSSG
jgi:hypothetical protein